MDSNNTETEDNSGRKILAQFKNGRTLVTIWEDESVSIERMYKPDDDSPWKYSTKLYDKDLELIQEPVVEAQGWFAKQAREERAAASEKLSDELRVPAQLL